MVVDPSPSIGIVLDDDDEWSLKFHEYIKAVEKLLSITEIKSVCFVDDKVFPGVQAADMVSYEARRAMKGFKENPSREISDVFIEMIWGKDNLPLLITADVLDELAKQNPEETERL